MSSIIPLLSRLVTWVGAYLVTSEVSDITKPYVTPKEEGNNQPKEPVIEGVKNRWKKTWRSKLIIALLSGIILMLLKYLFRNIKLKK